MIRVKFINVDVRHKVHITQTILNFSTESLAKTKIKKFPLFFSGERSTVAISSTNFIKASSETRTAYCQRFVFSRIFYEIQTF